MLIIHRQIVQIRDHCLTEAEGHLKVTCSNIPCKCGTILEMVQDRDVVE